MIEAVIYMPGDADQLDEATPEMIRKLDIIAKIPTSFVATLKAEKPVGIIGGHQIYPGVYETWSVLSEAAKRYRFSLTRVIRHALKKQAVINDIRRYQMFVKDEEPLRRFAEILGFQWEGILRQFGTDRGDYFVYGRIN